jgi:ABC-type nitrate/sulfonate/bicarbonate transport system substrate-binding protein
VADQEGKMFKKKHSLSVVIVAALVELATLAACSAPPTPAPQFTLRVGFYPIQGYLPYFVMQEQGFDKQHGLQLVERTPYLGGAAVIEDMAAGNLEVGIAGSVPVLSAAERGLIPGKVVAVAANNFADPDHPGVGALVAPSVNSWKDLKGQYIAVNAVMCGGQDILYTPPATLNTCSLC